MDKLGFLLMFSEYNLHRDHHILVFFYFLSSFIEM